MSRTSLVGSLRCSQKLIDKECQSLGIRQVSFCRHARHVRIRSPELASDRFKYEEQFFDRVKGFDNIDVHVFTTFGRILCQGSTDRICHGEEAAKGGIMVTWDPSGDQGTSSLSRISLPCLIHCARPDQKNLKKLGQSGEEDRWIILLIVYSGFEN